MKHLDVSLTLIFAIKRLLRVDDVWAKLRQPTLTTTFQKKVQRAKRVTSVTPKLVFFVLTWTALQQQRFANLVLFHDKLGKTKLVPDLGT